MVCCGSCQPQAGGLLFLSLLLGHKHHQLRQIYQHRTDVCPHIRQHSCALTNHFNTQLSAVLTGGGQCRHCLRIGLLLQVTKPCPFRHQVFLPGAAVRQSWIRRRQVCPHFLRIVAQVWRGAPEEFANIAGVYSGERNCPFCCFSPITESTVPPKPAEVLTTFPACCADEINCSPLPTAPTPPPINKLPKLSKSTLRSRRADR